MSRYSNSSYHSKRNDDSLDSIWSRRSVSYSDGGRNENQSSRFEGQVPQIQGSSYLGFQEQTFSQGYQDMKPSRDRNQTYSRNANSSFDSNNQTFSQGYQDMKPSQDRNQTYSRNTNNSFDSNNQTFSQGFQDMKPSLDRNQAYSRNTNNSFDSNNQTSSQGFQDMKPSLDRNQPYSQNTNNVFDSDTHSRMIIRLEDRGYGESSRMDTNQLNQDYSRDGPYAKGSDRINRFPPQDRAPPPGNQLQNQPYPPQNRFQPSGSNQDYSPRKNQSHPQVSDDFQRVNPREFYNSEQILNRRNQFSPANQASPYSRNVDQYNRIETMNQAKSSLGEKYTGEMNTVQNFGQKQRPSMRNNEQRRNFPGPSQQNTYVSTNVELKVNYQFFSQTDCGGPVSSNVGPIEKKNFPIENKNFRMEKKNFPIGKKNFPIEKKNFPFEKKNFPIGKKNFPIEKKNFPIEKKKYLETKRAEKKEVKRLMEKTLEKTGLSVMDRVKDRRKETNMKLFKTPVIPYNNDIEAKYAEEYRLVEHIPPFTKKWYQVTIDDIRNRAGLVGNIVIMSRLYDTEYYNTLEKTAEAWNMKFVLTAEDCASTDNTKSEWIATATFNGVVLAKTKCETRGGARLSASARALWKLYQWYFAVMRGGTQGAKHVSKLDLRGIKSVKNMVIYPNSASQLKNKDAQNCFNLNGTIDDLKNKIREYATDTTNFNDLVFSNDFNAKARKSLIGYARTFKCLQPRSCGSQRERQVVLCKRVNATTGINGWTLIEDILKNKAVYEKTKQYILYAPGDYDPRIPYKYPNVTYLDEEL